MSSTMFVNSEVYSEKKKKNLQKFMLKKIGPNMILGKHHIPCWGKRSGKMTNF